MKKSIALVLSILSLALSAGIFTGCGSTKIALQEHSPVAVFSIIGNSQVPWIKDDPNDPDESEADGILSSMVNKLIDGQNPEIVTAVDRLDYANDSIRQILPEMTGCEVLEKDAVVSSEAYDNLRASYFNALSATKSATGYKDLTTIGSKSTRIALEGMGAKSAVLLNFTFQKKLLKGNKWNGELAGLVTLKAKLLNERGKELINKTYEVQTSQRIKITSHKYDKNEFVTSLNEGIDSAIRQFALEFIGAEDEEVSESSGEAQAIAIPIKTSAKASAGSEAQTDGEAQAEGEGSSLEADAPAEGEGSPAANGQ